MLGGEMEIEATAGGCGSGVLMATDAAEQAVARSATNGVFKNVVRIARPPNEFGSAARPAWRVGLRFSLVALRPRLSPSLPLSRPSRWRRRIMPCRMRSVGRLAESAASSPLPRSPQHRGQRVLLFRSLWLRAR